MRLYYYNNNFEYKIELFPRGNFTKKYRMSREGLSGKAKVYPNIYIFFSFFFRKTSATIYRIEINTSSYVVKNTNSHSCRKYKWKFFFNSRKVCNIERTGI